MEFEPYLLPGTDPLEHMAVEEVLVASWRGPAAAILFYVNSPCVVVGRSQNPWREVGASCPFRIFRRLSGGGAVYHDLGNLNWAIIVPRGAHSQELELTAVADAISTLGAPVLAGERGGIFGAPGSAIGGRKVSGTARRFGIANVLHHGTLLVDADMDALRSSLGGIATVDDASIPSVPAHPANLAQAVPGIDMETAISGISRAISGASPKPIDDALVDRAAADASRLRFSSSGWIYGLTPKFSLEVGLGECLLRIQVVEGRVFSVDPPPSGLRSEKSREIFRRVHESLGTEFSFQALSSWSA